MVSSNNAWAEVASRLVEQGVVVVIAASNNGYDGPFFASNVAAENYVLGVASVEPSELVAPPFLPRSTLTVSPTPQHWPICWTGMRFSPET